MRYSQGRLTTNTTSNNAILEIINSSTTKSAFIKRLVITQGTAAAGVIEIGRPTAKGITPTTPVALESDDDAAAGSLTSALAWGTAPTRPTTFLRRANFLATVGDARTFEFIGKGLRLAPGQTLVVHSFSGTSNVYNVSVEAEQDDVVVTSVVPE